MITKTIAIPQLNNARDADTVRRALYDVWGVNHVEISWERGEATVQFDEMAASLHDFHEAVLESGFQLESSSGGQAESLHDWRSDE